MRKRFWLWALSGSLLGAGCGATEQTSSVSLANSPARIAQVFNDGQKIVVNGQTDGKSHLSLVIGDLKWTASGDKPDEFIGSLEPSEQVPLGKGRVGKGFVFNVGDSRFNVSGKPMPAGELVLRKNSQIVQQGNEYVVADLMEEGGKKIPVIVRLQAKNKA